MSISLSSLILLPIWINMAQIQQGGPDEKEKTTALKDLLSRIDLDELMKKDEPPLDFPDTLEGFEYAFNEKGQLRHIKTGEPFVFNYREDLHRWNQKRYEALGEVDATETEPKSFIYMSEDALTNPQKLMVLIHGSGVVRAGQWARRLIINEDLDSGTQIPFIKRAVDEGYGVIVLNPNENYIEVEKPKIHVQSSSDSSDEPAEKRERKDKVSKETKKRRDFYEKYRNPQREKEMMQLYIRENGSPEEHAIYVWDHFIAQSAAENVFFVAHSYGGLAFVELMIQREADVKNKVTAVALTDSVHNVWHQEAGKTIREWMREFFLIECPGGSLADTIGLCDGLLEIMKRKQTWITGKGCCLKHGCWKVFCFVSMFRYVEINVIHVSGQQTYEKMLNITNHQRNAN
ncbi:cotranscriptional regulator FAM172A isoform X3 [Sapajus apella]|uniref:Cotranscriptional regulator FAM172A isoform X3 n=1 Tax=Sapajus apella TaxID=9515 RepID=A0A6J3HMB0_SAPAP|nr:cotranscriptional regulator FAM172A isoform X3 [Sapajus apella]